jgi:hypothetical protein
MFDFRPAGEFMELTRPVLHSVVKLAEKESCPSRESKPRPSRESKSCPSRESKSCPSRINKSCPRRKS